MPPKFKKIYILNNVPKVPGSIDTMIEHITHYQKQRNMYVPMDSI